MRDLGETLNVSLPKTMKAYVQKTAKERGFASVSEFIRHLIRKDMESKAR